jgi:hypothetical protein
VQEVRAAADRRNDDEAREALVGVLATALDKHRFGVREFLLHQEQLATAVMTHRRWNLRRTRCNNANTGVGKRDSVHCCRRSPARGLVSGHWQHRQLMPVLF